MIVSLEVVDGNLSLKILITAGVRAPRSVSGVRLTKTKQFVAFMTKCHPIVEELAASDTHPELLPISFATSVLRGSQRTLEEVTGAVGNAKVAPESGQTSDDEATGLPLDPKMVADVVNEELMFMRERQVYCEVPMSYLDKSMLKAIGTRWVYTN